MIARRVWVPVLILLAAGMATATEAARSSPAVTGTASVSGTIRFQGAPVAGVEVNVFWEGGEHTGITGPDGRYSAGGVPNGVSLTVHVHPPLQRRLAQRNWRVDGVQGNLTKDFHLRSGYVLRGELRQPDGQLFDGSMWLGLDPHRTPVPDQEWIGCTVEAGRFEVIVEPGVYTLETIPSPYYLPTTVVDLRQSDDSIVVGLLHAPQAPFPADPPLAHLITVGAPDMEGYADVTGGPGAVVPLAEVLVANISARNVSVCIADADGSFRTRLFAPPGSSLLIKEDPDGLRLSRFWRRAQPGEELGDFSEVNPLPGTVLYVSPPPPGDGVSQEFYSVGGHWDELRGLWGGYWISGTLRAEGGTSGGPGIAVRGDQRVRLTAAVRFTSDALHCAGVPDPSPVLHVHLRRLFGSDGREEARGIWFNAYLFTPTGLPIEHEGGGGEFGVVSLHCSALTCTGPNSFDGVVDGHFRVPEGLPDGFYEVAAYVDHGGLPLSSSVPAANVWYHPAERAPLPYLRLGSPQAPRIHWTLLADVPVNGQRGLVAREDAPYYGLAMRTTIPPHRTVLPRLDARTGEPIGYRLEPGAIWISSNDRRLPNPPAIPFALPSGTLSAQVARPDGLVDSLGPAPIRQSSVRTPTLPGGDALDFGTGHLGDLYHLTTLHDGFDYRFEVYGHHAITLSGTVQDIYGGSHVLQGTYDVDVARVLDLDPGQLPTTPYKQGDAFAPGLHVFPPVPAVVRVSLVHMPLSDPTRAVTRVVEGTANRFGYFQPPVGTRMTMESPGEFRVDYTATYTAPDGTLWMGASTWGNVVEGPNPQMEAHGRRGMDYQDERIDDMPAWFEVFALPPQKVGIENYYPYFSGDVHWGNEDRGPGDSIHSVVTVKDLTGSRERIYGLIREHYPRATNGFRWPPNDMSLDGLGQRLAIGEAPLFITTDDGTDPKHAPERIDLWGYWYGSSQRPDVRVREIISEDNMGTAYWRFDDTYGYQIGEPANGDQPGDIKWEFGGAVLRKPAQAIAEYAIYSSFWVLLPHGDSVGARVTPPFQDATGASINGGPVLTLLGKDIDMLFLPKGVRPGDVLEVGDTISFSGHVGPPLDSRVSVTITSPSGVARFHEHRANRIGWVYEPDHDMKANEAGCWTVDVSVLHDRPYVGNGVIPMSHNAGTVLGTSGRYEFYVVPQGSMRLPILQPSPGVLPWARGVAGLRGRIQPISIRGRSPPGTTQVRYTIHDKGIVMGQGSITPDAYGLFTFTYDAEALHDQFPMVSLTAHEGIWEGLADEVSIRFMAEGNGEPAANAVTLIGEEVFVGSDGRPWLYLPVVVRKWDG